MVVGQWHLSPDGTPRRCHARLHCRFGGAEDHFDSYDKAIVAAERRIADGVIHRDVAPAVVNADEARSTAMLDAETGIAMRSARSRSRRPVGLSEAVHESILRAAAADAASGDGVRPASIRSILRDGVRRWVGSHGDAIRDVMVSRRSGRRALDLAAERRIIAGRRTALAETRHREEIRRSRVLHEERLDRASVIASIVDGDPSGTNGGVDDARNRQAVRMDTIARKWSERGEDFSTSPIARASEAALTARDPIAADPLFLRMTAGYTGHIAVGDRRARAFNGRGGMTTDPDAAGRYARYVHDRLTEDGVSGSPRARLLEEHLITSWVDRNGTSGLSIHHAGDVRSMSDENVARLASVVAGREYMRVARETRDDSRRWNGGWGTAVGRVRRSTDRYQNAIARAAGAAARGGRRIPQSSFAGAMTGRFLSEVDRGRFIRAAAERRARGVGSAVVSGIGSARDRASTTVIGARTSARRAVGGTLRKAGRSLLNGARRFDDENADSR